MGEQPEFTIAEACAAIAEAEKQLESDIPYRAELGTAMAELRADITNGEPVPGSATGPARGARPGVAPVAAFDELPEAQT
jgi:hypothetical protein